MIKVLIVEDEALLAMNLQNGLEEFNCEVVGTAVSGEEAIRKAGSLMPSVVLMDIKLRGNVDGISAAKAINDNYNIPIIYLTGNTDEATRKRVFDTHPLRYLEKPIEVDTLYEIIQQSL